MRLLYLSQDGIFGLTKYLVGDDLIPPYAIFSHTWGSDNEEVTFDDIINGTGKDKTGYEKIQFCGKQARQDNLRYFWIDTCCINKSTNDELSTAINSMFRWYQRSSKCYVYLSDVSVPDEVTDTQAFRITWEYAFRQSRWFTRGWTLQELLAPATVEFFSRNGRRLGTKISLEQEIHDITKIPVNAIRGERFSNFSINERMSWSSERSTTLKEDRVYCLLGIFGVFMPLIYGEGEEYANLRFRDEIQKRCREYLQHIQTTSYLGLPSSGRRKEVPHLAFGNVSQIVEPIPSTTSRRITSRNSLLCLDSFLRKLGFYGSIVRHRDAGKAGSQFLVRIGVCPFEMPWLIGSNTLELLLSYAAHDKIHKFNWEIQLQYRVPEESPLMKACQMGDVTLMQQILEEGNGGINDQISCSGKTPLMVAIDGMHSKAVEFLLQNGADPNIPDDDQILPVFAVAGMNLHRSQHFEQLPPTWNHWLETFRLLVRYGASTDEIVRGRTLAGLNIARPGETSKVLPFLQLLAGRESLAQESLVDHPRWLVLRNAVEAGTDTVNALKLLQACGMNITRVLDDGKTVLHLVAHLCQNDQPLSYLLTTASTAEINRQDRWGWTPLHYALLARTSAEGPSPYSMAVMLIKSGADPTIKGQMNPRNPYHFHSEHLTALELLEYARYSRFELAMDTLNDRGIDIRSSADTVTFYDAEEYVTG